MNSFLIHLYDYISEHTPTLNHDPEYQQAVQVYAKLEEEIQQKIGEDLLDEYRCAEANIARQQNIAVFSHTLRLGHSFILELLRS